MEKYIVKENEILIEFLKKMFSNLSKNSVKSLLHNEKVFVNCNMTTKYNYELNIGDVVEIRDKDNKTRVKTSSKCRCFFQNYYY